MRAVRPDATRVKSERIANVQKNLLTEINQIIIRFFQAETVPVRTPLAECSNHPYPIVHGLSRKSTTTGELFQTVRRQRRLELSPCSYCRLPSSHSLRGESKSGGEWAWLFLSILGHGGECAALVRELFRVLVAVARPTLSVDRQLRYSFAMPKVGCGCPKVGLDFVSTHFQAVARHFGRLERIA